MPLLKSKNVPHVVQARRLPDQPFGRPQSASREGDPVCRAVGDLHPFPGCREGHRVLPHDVAGAQARETDGAGGTRCVMGCPVIDRDLRQVPAGDYELLCSPLKYDGATGDGSPARTFLRSLS